MSVCIIKPQKSGLTISFQTRGLSVDEANKIWKRIDVKKIIEWCEETGHNLISWEDGLVVDVNKIHSGYSVWLGKGD